VVATSKLEKSLDFFEVSYRFEGEAMYLRTMQEVEGEMSSSSLAWHRAAALSDGLWCPFVECLWCAAQSSLMQDRRSTAITRLLLGRKIRNEAQGRIGLVLETAALHGSP
jgi:hypothetical protein